MDRPRLVLLGLIAVTTFVLCLWALLIMAGAFE
jgi:hypothetical protein